MEAQAEILIPFELQFSDLLLLSNPSLSSSSLSSGDIARLELLSSSIMQTLGSSGPGLLSVAGVPKADELRRSLLPLARKLTLLGSKDRARILKEHGLGSDVSLKDPDRTVSSFALQLKYVQDPSLELLSCECGPRKREKDRGNNIEENPSVHWLQELHDLEFKQLGSTFNELGHCMMELGLQLARVCDKAIGSRELEQSIIDSCTAKGRLIHYHSMLDNLILKEGTKKTKGTMKKAGPVTCTSSVSTKSKTSGNRSLPEWGRVTLDEQPKLEKLRTENGKIEPRCRMTSFSNLWQQWHYDYGIFTVLTAPWFTSSMPMEDCTSISRGQPFSSPDEHTYLQLFDATENKILVVKSSPESFIIQVGEAADILSGGRLRSTLHSVGRPIEIEDLSRETLVVFLQPTWSKTLSYPEHLNVGTSQADLPSNKDDHLHMIAGFLDAVVIFCYLAAVERWFVLPPPFVTFELELWLELSSKPACIGECQWLAS